MLKSGFNRSSRVRSLLPKNNWDAGSPVVGCSQILIFTLHCIFETLDTTFYNVGHNDLQRSAKPLVAGWLGAEVKCLIPFLLRNCWNSSDLNCDPLSLTNWAGTPYLANKFWRGSMVFAQVVVFILSLSICSHLECASTTTESMLLRKSPAKSTFVARATKAIPMDAPVLY